MTEENKPKTLKEALDASEFNVDIDRSKVMTRLGVFLDLTSVDKEYGYRLLQNAFPSVDFNSLRLVSLVDAKKKKEENND